MDFIEELRKLIYPDRETEGASRDGRSNETRFRYSFHQDSRL